MKKAHPPERRCRWDWRDALSPLWAWLQVVLFSVAAFLLLVLLCVLFLSAERLGVLFLPALIAYFGALAAAAGWLLHRREKRDFLAAVGQEIYDQTYPREARRRERREAKKTEEKSERKCKK